MLSANNNISPEMVASVLSPLLETEKGRRMARVLDVGAGTGLVGQEMEKRGFRNIEAVGESILKVV